jgi:hypothetical protein
VSSLVQQTLSVNQAQYAKMAQFEGEVQTQLTEMEKILGPDKELGGSGSEQFAGLIGLQKELTKQREDLRKADNDMFAEFNEQEREQTNLEATIEAEQMQRVGSCLYQDTTLVSGGCPKPVQQMGADGKPQAVMTRNGRQQFEAGTCGTVEAISNRIKQSAVMNASNNSLQDRDSSRIQGGQMAAKQFEAIMSRINIELGVAGPKREGATGALRPNVKSWADIEKNSAIMSSLKAIENSNGGRLKRVGIIQTLKRSMNACVQESKSWVRAERDNGQFKDRSTKLEGRRSLLANRMNSAVDGLNRSLAMAVDGLSHRQGNHVAVNRAQCASVSPKSTRFGNQFNATSACFKQVSQNLSDLLDGNDRAPMSQFSIAGGTMKPGFTVPCRGINGCVTALKASRQQQQDQLTSARQIKLKMIQDSNQSMDSQLQSFAGALQLGAQTVKRQFEAMRDAMVSLGLKTLPELKLLAGEALEYEKIKGPNGEEVNGPYKAPKNMAGVLSQLAGGLPDPQDSGIKTGLEAMATAVDEKKKALAEKAKGMKEELAKQDQQMNACLAGANFLHGVAGDSENANSNSSFCTNLSSERIQQDEASVVDETSKVSQLLGSLKAIFSKKDWEITDRDKFGADMTSLYEHKTNLAANCSEKAKSLRTDIDSFINSTTATGK